MLSIEDVTKLPNFVGDTLSRLALTPNSKANFCLSPLKLGHYFCCL